MTPNGEPESFELAVRILGNEIVAFSMKSDSSRKQWIVIGVVAFVLALHIVSLALPILAAALSIL